MDNTRPRDVIFYDGHCGLCHGAVKWVMARDPRGEVFDFSPLQGKTFAAAIAAEKRAGLPDSVVIRTRDGRLLTRSDATIYILDRLEGPWRRRAQWLKLVPRWLRDLFYVAVARMRKILSKPGTVCPVVPAAQRSRFLD